MADNYKNNTGEVNVHARGNEHVLLISIFVNFAYKTSHVGNHFTFILPATRD